jgi:Holliday junction resolvase
VTSPQARKGANFERAVVAYLRDHGYPHAERSYGAGRPEDVGDIDGLPGVVFELKAHRQIELASFLDEAEAERVNADAELAVVVIKRRGHSDVGRSYAVVTLAAMAELLREHDR